LQSLLGAVSAVGVSCFAEILEDGRVAEERKKEALSAPTVLCPKLRRKLAAQSRCQLQAVPSSAKTSAKVQRQQPNLIFK
jgi:hypothetical protein